MQIVTLPLGGITSGTQPILSFNYGAKNIDRIKKGEKQIVKIAFLFCLIMFIISQTISGVFVMLFTQDPAYIDLSVWAIKVFTFGVIPLAFQYAFVDGLTALGIVKISVSLPKSVVPGADPFVPSFLGSKRSILCGAGCRHFLWHFQQHYLPFYDWKDPAQTRTNAGWTVVIFLNYAKKAAWKQAAF